MSTKRVALTLSKENFDLIEAMSKDLSITKSKVVNELLSLLGPGLSYISSVKKMVDNGLKATSEEAFRGFLKGMQEDFDGSVLEAEEAFTKAIQEQSAGSTQPAESMQAGETSSAAGD